MKTNKKRGKNMKTKNQYILITLSLMVAVSLIGCTELKTTNSIEAATTTVTYKAKRHLPINKDKVLEVKNEAIREVTAYNVGDPRQTDSTPCIGASGDDLCKILERGVKVCAANFVPLGTKLYINNYGECIVLDRMNRRYKNRVDIAMGLDEKQRALKFGKQKLLVKILK